MRLFYKGLALAATLVAATAFAKPYATEATTSSHDSIGGSSAFDSSPFASGPKSAFDNAQPLAKPRKEIGVQVTPVPEPGEWALMGAGLALVAYLARRNRRNKK